jgi:hypothetical protein
MKKGPARESVADAFAARMMTWFGRLECDRQHVDAGHICRSTICVVCARKWSSESKHRSVCRFIVSTNCVLLSQTKDAKLIGRRTFSVVARRERLWPDEPSAFNLYLKVTRWIVRSVGLWSKLLSLIASGSSLWIDADFMSNLLHLKQIDGMQKSHKSLTFQCTGTCQSLGQKISKVSLILILCGRQSKRKWSDSGHRRSHACTT